VRFGLDSILSEPVVVVFLGFTGGERRCVEGMQHYNHLGL